MKKKENIVALDINCNSKYALAMSADITFTLSGLIAIAQALQYTMIHKKEFQAEITDCEDCYLRIDDAQLVISRMIAEAEEHNRENHIN